MYEHLLRDETTEPEPTATGRHPGHLLQGAHGEEVSQVVRTPQGLLVRLTNLTKITLYVAVGVGVEGIPRHGGTRRGGILGYS